jgi:glycolate oxidase iron-sulfur subunit
MRTNFSAAQLADPNIAAAEQQMRACVHCGICTATCPTYVLLGDELDGPRGRIQLIQQMLETNAAPSPKVVGHIDRCLSCLACVSACPSGVNYPRLIDTARAHVERKAVRPFGERLLRGTLGTVLTRRWLTRPLLTLAKLGAPFASLLPKSLRAGARIAAALPQPQRRSFAKTYATENAAPKRVALHFGCVQEVVAPEITAAAIRVLTRHGYAVEIVEGSGCCGSLNHHLGQADAAHTRAKALVADIAAREAGRPFDAIATTVSGCGSTIRDFGFELKTKEASDVAARTRDIADLIADAQLKPSNEHRGTRVAYHAACSLTHGMKQGAAAPRLLKTLGFDVIETRDGLCCGSAGVYNALQPAIANDLRDRKAAALMATTPQLIATGNIGCKMHIASGVPVPVVHTIELIDWATGGPRPHGL